MLSGLLDTYKKELGEFVSTVKDDTSSVLQSAKEKLAHLNAADSDGDGDSDGERDGAGRGGPTALQRIPDFETFVALDLSDDVAFADFQSGPFSLESHEEQIDAAAADQTALLAEYVPGRMTLNSFWARFFYFQHVQRRARLLAGDMSLHQEEEDISWGDDDDDDDDDNGPAAAAAAGESPGAAGAAGAAAEGDGEGDGGEDDAAAKRSARAQAKEEEADASKLSAMKMRAALAEEKVAQLSGEVVALRERVGELEQVNAELCEAAEAVSASAVTAPPQPAPVPAPDAADEVQEDGDQDEEEEEGQEEDVIEEEEESGGAQKEMEETEVVRAPAAAVADEDDPEWSEWE